MITSPPAVRADVRAALERVTDPEYPDVSIVDLGLVERLDVDGGSVVVGLIPTFSGCPALDMIRTDVESAVGSVPGVVDCRVEWLRTPVWSTERLSERAADRLAREYTVVLRGSDGGVRCPVCGSREVREQAMAGPTRCRSIAWCDACRNPVEVMR